MQKLVKGLDEIEQKTQEMAEMNSGNYIKTLKIYDGEVSLIRFLTDNSEIISAPFHTAAFDTQNGTRYRPVYCNQAETGACPYCQQGKLPGEQIFLWAYVYYILHKTQNRKLEMDQNAERWTLQKIGTQTFYRQDINGVMLFRTGPGARGYIKNLIIENAREYDTLCDRDYKWARKGAGRDDTKYTLLAKDKSDTSDEVLEAAKTLPSLMDVVVGKVKTFTAGPVNEDALKDEGQTDEDTSDSEDLEKMLEGLI